MSSASQHPYVQFEGTKAWSALDAELTALAQNNDLIEQTDRRYIVGSLCKALVEAGINTSGVTTAAQKDVLYIRGWNVGFQKVAFTLLMQAQVGVSLSAAKDLTDKVLAGELVTVWVWNYALAAKLACDLGAVVRNKDGSEYANQL